jgi:hypothetical protein
MQTWAPLSEVFSKRTKTSDSSRLNNFSLNFAVAAVLQNHSDDFKTQVHFGEKVSLVMHDPSLWV